MEKFKRVYWHCLFIFYQHFLKLYVDPSVINGNVSYEPQSVHFQSHYSIPNSHTVMTIMAAA